MTDARDDQTADAVPTTPADTVTDASLTPMDDAAGGPSADRDEDEPSAEEAAAQLGDFA